MKWFDRLETMAAMRPEHIAVEDASGRMTYGQLMSRLRQSQRKLLHEGYHPGMKVIVRSGSQLEFILSFLSLLSVGCWVIPLSTDKSAEEVESLAEAAGAVVFPKGWFASASWPGDDPEPAFMKPAEEGTGICHLTSGTTDAPKLCIRPLQALVAEGEAYCRTFRLTPEDRMLSPAPMLHSYALGAGLMAALTAGMSIRTVDGFNPRAVLRLVEEHRITCLILVPAMARALGNTYAKRPYDLSSLRVSLVGAGPVTEETYNRFKERFGIALLSNYGSTETGGVISRLEPLPFASIGKPMHGVGIKLADALGGRVNTGEVGELWVKTDSMLSGYVGESSLPLDEEGYFPMGDLALQDSEGYLYIKGRTKLMINVGGKKVNPYEVEELLMTLPGVKECAVVGVPKPNGEEAVKAFIAAESHVTEEMVRKYCYEHLSGYKLPSRIEMVSGLPRNQVGKIKREELRKGYEI